jgi:hypothetical protein
MIKKSIFCFIPQVTITACCSQIHSPWREEIVDSDVGLSYRPARLHRLVGQYDWGDKVDSGKGLSYRPARLVGPYDNPMPESTIYSSQGLWIWLQHAVMVSMTASSYSVKSEGWCMDGIHWSGKRCYKTLLKTPTVYFQLSALAWGKEERKAQLFLVTRAASTLINSVGGKKNFVFTWMSQK